MMLQKLLKFFVENDCKLLIKYDGERDINKYTIRLLYNDIKCGSLGKDTDLPHSLICDMFKDNSFFTKEEAIDFFSNRINVCIDELKNKFGDSSVISLLLESKEEMVIYSLHIQTIAGAKHISDTNLEKMVQSLYLCESVSCK